MLGLYARKIGDTAHSTHTTDRPGKKKEFRNGISVKLMKQEKNSHFFLSKTPRRFFFFLLGC